MNKKQKIDRLCELEEMDCFNEVQYLGKAYYLKKKRREIANTLSKKDLANIFDTRLKDKFYEYYKGIYGDEQK